jgi:hypothetical protein
MTERCRTLRGVGTTALLAALGILGWGCARAGAPPGGPPDLLPPFVVEVVPDTFALVEGRLDRVTLRFSERISERPSRGTWPEVVTVSPESGEVRVRHRRDALEIRTEGGFRPGQVYRISLAPVVRDLFQNTMLDPFELVFSTGPAFDPTVLAGLVWDRITGAPLADHRVEAAAGDSGAVRHVARSDSSGIFAFRYIPAGDYRVTAFQDQNRNRELDAAEPRGITDARVGPADTVVVPLAVLAPDTTPAVVARVELQDSVTILVTLDDALDPELPLDDVRWRLVRLADSVEVPIIRGAYHRAGLEELRRQDREAEGLPPEEEEAAPSGPPGRGPAGAASRPTTTPDGRPLPARALFLPLSIPLVRGEPHLVEVEGVVNIHGIPGGGGSGRLERPPLADTAAAPSDTIPDTAMVVGVLRGGGRRSPLRPRIAP